MGDFTVNRERLIGTFLELAGINSPSRQEAAVAQHVLELLKPYDTKVSMDDAGLELGGDTGNLVVKIAGTAPGPALLFCSHMDAVQPTETLKVQRQDDVLTSDGTTILGADDKAGIAAIIEMVRALHETQTPHPPLELVFTICEEVGLMGSQVLDYGLISAPYGFVPDSEGQVGSIVTSAPSQKSLQFTVHGKACHAGIAPEQGVSAITIAARAIAGMTQGRIDEETTANIGIIAGGKATNIVPDLVTVIGEARSRNPQKLDAQAAHMRECFEREAQACGGSVDVEVTDVYQSFNVPADSVPVQLATAALAEVGVMAKVRPTGGGSDANFFNAHGVQTVILSVGYLHPHGTDESLDLNELNKLAQTLFNIAQLAGEKAE